MSAEELQKSAALFTIDTRPLVGLVLLLSGCGSFTPKDGGPLHPIDLSGIADAVPRVEPRSRYGNPSSYVVYGKRYQVMQDASGYVARGKASWYGTKFHGRLTSNREHYNMYAMTAAHRTLPLPTYVQVTNLKNGRTAVVRVNDRGPFHDERIIDLSYAAASKLGFAKEGTAEVEIRAITPAEPRPAVVEHRLQTSVQPLATSTRSAPGSQRLFLQVGAFIERANAERLRSRLDAEEMPPVRIDKVVYPETAYYRVSIGPIDRGQAADHITQRLFSMGLQGNPIELD